MQVAGRRERSDALAAADPVVTFRSATLGYEGEAVIRDLDLEVRAGEVVGLLGPNGSGKSTLVRAALGLVPVLGGRIELFGVDRASFREHRRVGYVPQRQAVTGGVPATVREVVAVGRLGRTLPFRRLRAADHAAIDDALDLVGLSERSTAPLATLSGGQQRRVMIARALASAPELLFLDEPTAGVDHDNQVALAGALKTLTAQGTTIVLVTHELGPAAEIVTRTVVLRDGRVCHDGPAHEAPDEHLAGHDDGWHHHHGEPPALGGLGLGHDRLGGGTT